MGFVLLDDKCKTRTRRTAKQQCHENVEGILFEQGKRKSSRIVTYKYKWLFDKVKVKPNVLKTAILHQKIAVLRSF